MVDKNKGKRSPKSNRSFNYGFDEGISDAQFINDVQVLLNSESMLKEDLADALCIDLNNLNQALVITWLGNKRLNIPDSVRQRARALRRSKECGPAFDAYNFFYNLYDRSNKDDSDEHDSQQDD